MAANLSKPFYMGQKRALWLDGPSRCSGVILNNLRPNRHQHCFAREGVHPAVFHGIHHLEREAPVMSAQHAKGSRLKAAVERIELLQDSRDKLTLHNCHLAIVRHST